MKKTLFLLTAFCSFFAFRAFSSDLLQNFNENLTKAQSRDLEDGRVIIRNLQSTKEMSLCTQNVYANKFMEELRAIHPTHIAEVIQVRPYKGRENLISELSALVSDIENYKKIPYFTERQGAWAAMFTKAEIISTSRNNLSSVYSTVFKMPPFSEFGAQVSTTQLVETLYFATVNKETIEYKIFDAVEVGKMECGLVAFRSDDYWILYGAGAVKTDVSFFVKKRVKTAFVNRIKDFSMYFIKKLN